MVGQEHPKDLQPGDATHHAGDEDKAAHDGLVDQHKHHPRRIALLKTIFNICHKKDGGINATTILDLVRMDKDMYLIHQSPNNLLSSHLLKFKGAVNVVESLGGSLWSHPPARKSFFNELYTPTTHAFAMASNLTEYQAATADAQCCYLTALFFHGLSNKTHRELKKKVHDDALTSSDIVPYTYDKVLQLTDQYKSSYQQHLSGGGGGRLTFLQKGKPGLATSQPPTPSNPSAENEKSG
jgi:hypothetical protein